jgi:MFS family permease
MSTLTPAQRTQLFWACFVALLATAFAFMLRMVIMPEWEEAFLLTKTQIGTLFGAGLWPFGVSIVVFSLILDKIGYGKAMVFAFICHVAFALMTIFASGYDMLYWGSVLGALAAGTVEAVINPLIATVYHENKTKWLNILHAGWPGGLVITGIVTLGLADAISWEWKISLILIPTIAYGIMLSRSVFPVSERVAAGIPYRRMLREVGWGGAFIVALMIVMELTANVLGIPELQNFTAQLLLAAGIAAIYGMFITDDKGTGLEGIVRSFGQPMYIFILLIMLLLATTELGTDTWIKDLLGPAIKDTIGIDGGWALVYSATIMMLLRIFCGPIIGALKPLGVLACSAAIAAIGLYWLGSLSAPGAATSGVIILIAATIYGIGQTFFWPTTLGFVAEQFPKGGAMTLNVVAGVGMLGVGVLGSVWLGNVQDRSIVDALELEHPALVSTYVTEPKESIFGEYQALATWSEDGVPADHVPALESAGRSGKSTAFKRVAVLPLIMLMGYICLILHFRQRGGYKPIELDPLA